MKYSKFYFLLVFIFIFSIGLNAQGENNKKLYSSWGLEFIFSFADVNADPIGVSVSNVIRFAPFVNVQWLLNYDLNKNVGVFSGIDVRNLGLIREDLSQDPQLKFKHRVYTLGLPIGVKIGNIDGRIFAYLGGQIEWAWNYKEKRFENNTKVHKFVEWNSKRVNQWQTSVFIGMNFHYGLNIKFKYYFDNLLNQDFIQYDATGGSSKPYAGQNSQIFYFSLNFFMFHPVSNYTKYVKGNEDEKVQRARLERGNLF